MKAESSKRKQSEAGPSSKARGTYVKQACAFCKRRKTRCDGKKPVCTPCESSGHECTWGPSENAKRPSTKQYVESLRNRIQALETQVSGLERRLSQCQCTQVLDDPSAEASAVSPAQYEDDDEMDDGFSVGSDNDIEELCSPTEHLVLERDDLQLYGPTSIFRLAPHHPAPTQVHSPPRSSTAETYTLLLDDSTEPGPQIDIARHLPPQVPLTRREHDALLDLFFKFFTSWTLRIVPSLFLRDMHRALSAGSQPSAKTPHYSPMLHNALLALATAFSDDARLRSVRTRAWFAERAKSYVEHECARPNVSVVHALGLIASFHSGQGDQTLGYLYFGMAGRMAQALGLNVDCSPWVKAGLITHEDKLDRDWTYWSVFQTDVCWSLYVGRDCCVSYPRIAVPLAEDPAESDFAREMDKAVFHYAPSGLRSQPSYLRLHFVATCELLRLARRISDVVNVLSSAGPRHQVDSAVISQIDVDLNSWKERLPSAIDITQATRATSTPHRIMMHLAYWWLFILLHRPFYRRTRAPASADIDHVKLCNRAAENIMELLGTYRTLYSLRYTTVTVTQVAFSAGTVYLLSAVQATSGARRASVALAHAIARAELCVQYLGESGESWAGALGIRDILRSLLEEQLKPRLEARARSPVQAPVEPKTDPSWIEHAAFEPAPFVGGTDLPMDGAEFDFGFSGLGGFSGMGMNLVGMPGGETLPTQPFMPLGMDAFEMPPGGDAGAQDIALLEELVAFQREFERQHQQGADYSRF